MGRKRRQSVLPREDIVVPGNGGCDRGHYWLIDGQTGPVSRGVCRDCGAEGEFLNSFDLNQVRALYGRKKKRLLEDATTDPELLELMETVAEEGLNTPDRMVEA